MAFNAMKFVRNGKLNIFGGFVYFFNKAERAGKIGGKFKIKSFSANGWCIQYRR